MSAALRTPELSPEAFALIKEGTPKPMVEKPVLAAPAILGETVSQPVAVDPVVEAESVKPHGSALFRNGKRNLSPSLASLMFRCAFRQKFPKHFFEHRWTAS